MPEPAAPEAPAAPERVIDVPLEQLPEIDEHATLIAAPVETTWRALLGTVPHAFAGRLSEAYARLVGCVETQSHGEPGTIGSTMPGFICARSIAPAVLALEGRHRFSLYALVFRLEPTKDGKTLLRAETRARFPGLLGRIYRLLVIGTRGHVLAVNSLLRAVRKRAEAIA